LSVSCWMTRENNGSERFWYVLFQKIYIVLRNKMSNFFTSFLASSKCFLDSFFYDRRSTLGFVRGDSSYSRADFATTEARLFSWSSAVLSLILKLMTRVNF
jgi:hypothetical protein